MLGLGGVVPELSLLTAALQIGDERSCERAGWNEEIIRLSSRRTRAAIDEARLMQNLALHPSVNWR
jgi:hypothetical protein